MEINPLDPTSPNKTEIMKITGKSKNIVYGVFNGKSKKPLVTAEEFCMASYCTWKNITMHDLETVVKNRDNSKTNWCKSKQDGLIRYDEISNNKPLFMLFSQDGKYLHGSAELQNRKEEIRRRVFI